MPFFCIYDIDIFQWDYLLVKLVSLKFRVLRCIIPFQSLILSFPNPINYHLSLKSAPVTTIEPVMLDSGSFSPFYPAGKSLWAIGKYYSAFLKHCIVRCVSTSMLSVGFSTLQDWD